MESMRSVVLLTALVSVAIAAQANDIPTFNVTQGTAVVTVSPDVVGDLSINFGGPGFFMIGSGTVTDCGFCVHSAPPGYAGLTGFNTITNSGPNIGSVGFGGVVYNNVLFHGLVTIAGAGVFSLPTTIQPSFTITLPVTFSGQLMACPVTSDLNGCASADIGTFNFQHLNGKVTIDFVSGGGTYTFDKAIYTLNAVPEPTTLALVGTGSFLLLFRRRRRPS